MDGGATGTGETTPASAPSERRRVRVLVRGLVQGVGFRAAAARRARELRVDGWVRNLPDGRVEAVAEGSAEAVEEFLAFCRRGAAGARVDGLLVSAEPPAGEAGFRVLTGS